ncbi:hypothetical protein ACH347_14185 [Saccharopolyspora sp. 5N102]|uniref:hypothetical protein n=1 Tax=Saccharopolyspora sp. 5N102 TaxID=3375155 RepID=UPI0037B22BAA
MRTNEIAKKGAGMDHLKWRATPGDLDPAHRAAIAAIEASMRAGFRFRHLPTIDNLLALQGIRISSGVIDVYLTEAPHIASAARFRVEDIESGVAPPSLWYRNGTVEEVVRALLDLPPHGSPGAPNLARSRSLWLPGDDLLRNGGLG